MAAADSDQVGEKSCSTKRSCSGGAVLANDAGDRWGPGRVELVDLLLQQPDGKVQVEIECRAACEHGRSFRLGGSVLVPRKDSRASW